MGTPYINAMIVDDHFIIRKLLAYDLNSNTPIHVIAKSASGFEALETLEKLKDKINLVIVDSQMPEMRGEELIKRIRKKYKQNIYIIGYSIHDDNLSRLMMLKAGANGFVSKIAKPHTIYNTFLAPFGLEYKDENHEK